MFSVSPIWSKYISVALLFGICLHNAEANRKCLPMIGFLLCGHNKKAGLLSFSVLLLYVVVMMMNNDDVVAAGWPRRGWSCITKKTSP